MPHFKCVACKTRLYSAAASADLVGDLCPDCGSPLEPVGELAEIVGFRSIESGHGARREAILAQARLDAERGIDDGGSFSPEAVADAMAATALDDLPTTRGPLVPERQP
jgi:hypothetical protein